MTNSEIELNEVVIDVVREILKHLYDYAYLESSDLMQRLQAAVAIEYGIRYVHDEVIRAIESLNPGPQVSFHAPNARTYNLLQLHYVEKLLIQDTADELSLSIRQAHRDLRNGEIAVAKILLKYLQADADTVNNTIHTASSVQEEFTNLDGEPEPSNVFKLLSGACKAVEQLITQKNTQIDMSSVDPAHVISTNPVVARQILISILARLIILAGAGKITVEVTEDMQHMTINFFYTPEQGQEAPCRIDATVQNLMTILKWQLEQERCADEGWRLSLNVPGVSTSVLIIDDNQALVNLLSRYLSVHNILARGLSDAQSAVEFARQSLPRVIILDVMMPGMDGWELLQNIKNTKELSNIPIIVCSVLNEPDLAYSLGASLFIQKPINQNVVTAALKELQII